MEVLGFRHLFRKWEFSGLEVLSKGGRFRFRMVFQEKLVVDIGSPSRRRVVG